MRRSLQGDRRSGRSRTGRGRHGPRGALIAPAALAALLGAAACATTGSSGPAGATAYELRGAYTARLTVERQAFEGAMSLRTSADDRVTGSLRVVAPVRIDGPVRGRLVDELLRITVTYRDQDGCDSRIEGILTVERGGDGAAGPVTVHDCGRELPGRLVLAR